MDRFVSWLAESTGLEPVLKLNYPGVEAVKKVKNGKPFLILLNHNRHEVEIELPGFFKDLITEKKHCWQAFA